MTAEEGTDEIAAPPHGRRLRWMLRGLYAFALLIVVVLAIAWWQRRAIADDVLRRELARRGVVAQYRVADIGLARQRIENLVIGDPAHPDLVADWVEVGTSLGFGTAEVTGVRAGQVRLRGRIVDGQLKLGELDKLMPAPSGKPFALPALFVDVADARIRLETQQGVVGMKLTGRGRLDDGFTGQAAAVAERIDASGCIVERAAAYLSVSIADAQPSLTGPVRAAAVGCGDARIVKPVVMLNAQLDSRLDRWKGDARIAVARLMSGQGQADSLDGTVSFDGSAAATTGVVDLKSGAFAALGRSGSGLALSGRYRAGDSDNGFDGTVSASGLALADADRRMIASIGGAGAGTPVAPLLARLAGGLMRAGTGLDLEARLSAILQGQGGNVVVERLSATSASGAIATLSGGAGVQYGWPATGLTLNGVLSLSGGDLPSAIVQLSQRGAGQPVTGTALIQPYATPDARLTLTPVSFSAAGGAVTRVSTSATLSGPLSGGRVEGLTMPIDARISGSGAFALGPACTPVSWQKLAVSSLVLDPGRMTLCPTGPALFAMAAGRTSGGARIAATTLKGRIGSTPLDLAAQGGEVRLTDLGFVLAGVAARIGSGDDRTRLDVARLAGAVARDGTLGGTLSGAAGKITNVPLLFANGGGDWRLTGGRLAIDGALDLDDAQADTPRFERLHSPDFKLGLVDGKIHVTGTLAYPKTGAKVAGVTIDHDLSATRGGASIDVPAIAFDPDGLQPSDLTNLTKGVIAAVKGGIAGDARIDWTAKGVTSTGTFRTAGTDLAAAFGPVTGLSGEVNFTDLLGLTTAPGQVATLAVVNPGVPVHDGTIRYQLLPGQRVAIEGGEWPFAGGALTLEPTVLDFSQSVPRHMTFRVKGVDAQLFLQEFNFENLDTTGTFDGELPMIFDETGGRIVGGRLQVREGGGTISYVGEVSQKDVGVWGNVAFQALKALRYRNLYLDLNGPLDGEMVTAIHFSGVSQGDGTTSNFIIRRIAKLPFVFNITITAPFRQLIDSVQGFYDPKRLIERNLPALLEQQRKAKAGSAPTPAPAPPPVPKPDAAPPPRAGGVQPPESEKMP